MISALHSIKILLLAIAFSLGATLVYAWTGPTAAAPNANTATPINVGATAQIKSGVLEAGGFGTGGGGIFGTSVQSPQFCLGGACINSWPIGDSTGGD